MSELSDAILMAQMAEQSRLRARLAELDRIIEAAPQWGAALSVMDEERRGIKRALAGAAK